MFANTLRPISPTTLYSFKRGATAGISPFQTDNSGSGGLQVGAYESEIVVGSTNLTIVIQNLLVS